MMRKVGKDMGDGKPQRGINGKPQSNGELNNHNADKRDKVYGKPLRR